MAQPGLGLGDVQVLTKGITVRMWTVENGLPQSAVTELSRDRDGYLWGATFGGLFRFDGRAIKSYTSAALPFLSGNSVTALTHLRNGDLLLGTPAASVIRLRDGKFVDSLPTQPGPPRSSGIDELTDDGENGVWVRRSQDVHHVRGGRWGAALPYPGVTALLMDAQGRLFYGGPQGLIRVGRDGVARKLSPAPVIQLGRSYGMHFDAAGRLWMGSTDGLWVYDEARGARRVFADSGIVNSIVSDSTGTLWFGAGEKLYRYSRQRQRSDSAPEVVMNVNARIVSIATTLDGLVVVGTLEGMLLVRGNAINVLDSRRTIPNVETGSIVSAGDSTVWVTSACSDVLRLGQGGAVIDSVPRPNPKGCTRSLATDGRKRLWVGGDGVITRRTAGLPMATWQVAQRPPGESLVRPLLATGDSLVFGMSDGRVGVIGADDRLSFLPGWETQTGRPIESMIREGTGALWIAQQGRLSRWQSGRSTTFGAADGIPGSVPRALYTDATGGLWMGTYGAGLWYFREGSGARAVPVLDQTISAIIQGPNDRIWMPGNRGLSIIPMRTLRQWVLDSTETPDIRLLSYTEGVPEGNLGYPAATSLAPGLLAFSSVTGLVMAHSWGVVTSGVTPAVRVDEMRSPTGALKLRDGRFRLPPDARLVYATFSMPTFRFGEVALFRYRLDDGPWISLGNSRELQFTLSRPGQYRLELQGKVPGGEWRGAQPMQLEVTPHFAELQWPRWLLAGVILALVAAVARQRVRTQQLAARSREIELQSRRDSAMLAERHQREMAQVGRVAVAGELTASLSHELGQPLAAIVNNAEVARRLLARQTAQGGASSPAIEEALQDVVAQGRRASQVVREFRRFLRHEQGEREQLTVRELLDSTAVLLRQEYADRGVPLHIDVSPGTPLITVERVLVQQVLVNLLQNALEAARVVRGGFVLVRARPARDGVRITVADNGSGFAADVRRSAFEPFVTTRASGMGMGLAIARRVVEAQGGRIGVGHLPGAGAVVSLWLPLAPATGERTDSLVPLQVTMHG